MSPSIRPSRSPAPIGLALLGLILAVAGAATAQQPSATDPAPILWRDADGDPLPFTSHTEAEEFLRHAEVVESEPFDVGITGLKRLVLEQEGVRARAAFHEFDETTRDVVIKDHRYREYHDSYRNQCAAYALARLLGIDNVPPTVCRTVEGVEGSVQLWVEGARSEEERIEDKLDPPRARDWMRQVQRMRLFDALVFNDDRHANNFLLDPAWNLWMIDHTRAFQHARDLPDEMLFAYCERVLWDRLRSLTDEDLHGAVGQYLDVGQIAALRQRRAKLIRYIEERIAERGEGAILLDGELLLSGQ